MRQHLDCSTRIPPQPFSGASFGNAAAFAPSNGAVNVIQTNATEYISSHHTHVIPVNSHTSTFVCMCAGGSFIFAVRQIMRCAMGYRGIDLKNCNLKFVTTISV